MSRERYPADLVLTEADFAGSGWKEALASTTRDGYSSTWQAFSAAAAAAMEDNRMAHGKVLWLLGDACSMTLEPQSTNAPFTPSWVMQGKRSAIPDDLTDADIAYFAQIVGMVDDPWLKARLADLVWLRQKPGNVTFAHAAVDAYRAIPLDAETWVHDGRECWERAIILARMVRDGSDTRLGDMATRILTSFNTTTREDGFLGLWLATLLKDNGLGRDQSTAIAEKLAALARDFNRNSAFHEAREYFSAARGWYKVAGDEARVTEMTVAVAEGWVNEAIAMVSADQPSHMVAASFYENAIKAYRSIPRSARAGHRVAERVAELHTCLMESGEKSLDEMVVIATPGIDVSEMIEHARNVVRGKSAVDALRTFVTVHGGTIVKDSRESAIQRLRKHPLQALFPVTVMSRDGRVIAKRPGMTLGADPSTEDEISIRSEMIRDYVLLIGIVVQGKIVPALEVLLLEHRLRESAFVELATQSPVVPSGREQLFGKALFAGYDHDFSTALHLLIPQIEHLIRFHLKQAGVKTTTLNHEGIENEIGMSGLMDLPESDQVFGEDLAFEMRALFCDPHGPNLRNKLAHGLLDDEACQSIAAVYAWWLGLKLVFSSYWNAARERAKAGEEGEAP